MQNLYIFAALLKNRTPESFGIALISLKVKNIFNSPNMYQIGSFVIDCNGTIYCFAVAMAMS